MEFISEDLQMYVEKHTEAESDLLHELNRTTHLKVMYPRMLSGHLQGKTLEMFSLLLKPARVLEIGTYTGYSAICLAAGLTDGGHVDTIDINPETAALARAYAQKAGLSEKIHFHTGNALDIIPTLPGSFDLVFIDADKSNYSAYFDLVIDRVPSGGLVIADNVLWSGKVLNPEKNKDKDTLALIDFNRKVQEDSRVMNVLLPVRDGLMVMVKK
jgi:predicted O-methyltransferase YrrM